MVRRHLRRLLLKGPRHRPRRRTTAARPRARHSEPGGQPDEQRAQGEGYEQRGAAEYSGKSADASGLQSDLLGEL
ncbi:hypothetical protein BN2537_3361 [Streptomyces venezuelae]|nr:hypothetical protein BN2537_3361 [Streptomyces venezuelae]